MVGMSRSGQENYVANSLMAEQLRNSRDFAGENRREDPYSESGGNELSLTQNLSEPCKSTE